MMSYSKNIIIHKYLSSISPKAWFFRQKVVLLLF